MLFIMAQHSDQHQSVLIWLFQKVRTKTNLKKRRRHDLNMNKSFVYGKVIVIPRGPGTCLSRHCVSLSSLMARSCSGLIPLHLSVRTWCGFPPPVFLSAASAHSVIMSDVSVCLISARFSLSSLLCCSISFSSCSAACGGQVMVRPHRGTRASWLVVPLTTGIQAAASRKPNH